MRATAPPLELWGGIECTVNRTTDRIRDQVVLSGHQERIDDLDLFAGLGLRAIRYPVLWERTMPGDLPDWSWPDARLGRLRDLGVRPIVGLVHHGSGPFHTNLLDDGFATGLADYAGKVARRYPWVDEWTPVNEPLTTARFAALYGHWYPHARDERSFWIALLNQIDATRLSMRAIRQINPGARLIQTEDLGRTYATPPLAAQAAHDNERRWATWDLLFGRVDQDHVLFEPVERLGLGDRLRRIADDPSPPDTIGLNHYLTSDRFLDHQLDRYPEHLHGGNRRSRYADTEAVRVLEPPPAGLAGAITEAWARYGTPIALTEVHNGCTREEQLRWVAEAWDAALLAREAGINVAAVTAWALLGSHGWDTLLTTDGAYEPGVFDVASGTPRPTALAGLWRGLPHCTPRHAVVHGPGWWRRPERLIYDKRAIGDEAVLGESSGVLIIGCGTLTKVLTRACGVRGLCYILARTREEARSLIQTVGCWGIVDVTMDGATAPPAFASRNAPVATAIDDAFEIVGAPASGFDASRSNIDLMLDRLIDRAIGF